MQDFKNLRIEEPISLEAKLVHGGAFIAVMLAIIVGACL